MQEAVPLGKGAMAAIIGLDRERVDELIQKVSSDKIVQPANFNSLNQIVIAGEREGVEEAVRIAREDGAIKAVLLPVSGPFHSSLMQPAAERLKTELDKIEIKDLSFSIIANVNAEKVSSKDRIKELLVEQLYNPVQWERSISKLIEEGIDTFIEVGPGKVLTGLLRRISKDVQGFNVEDTKSLEKTLNSLDR